MARLRRLEPAWFASRLVPLPDEDGEVLVGTDPDAGVVLQAGERSEARHARLFRERGLWRLEPFSIDSVLNGSRIAKPPPILQHGDLLGFGASREGLGDEDLFVFEDRADVRLPELEAAVAQAPGDEQRVRVWADALQEQGDPFGEHLARAVAQAPGSPDPWLDGLWREVSHGLLELEWRHGLIRAATLRSNGRLEAQAWPFTLSRLFALRVAFTLESLVIDLPGLQSEELPMEDADLELALGQLVRWSAEADFQVPGDLEPGLAPTLRSLSLGYQTAGHASGLPTFTVPSAWKHLQGQRVFEAGARPQLVVESIGPGLIASLKAGARVPLTREVLAFVTPEHFFLQAFDVRERRAPAAQLSPMDLRWSVTGDRLKVNGRPCRYAQLLPGDRLTLADQVTLRFELAPRA